MAVVEGGNRLYMTELGSIKHAYKSEYSILGKDDHVRVQSVHEGSESMYMVTSCHTQVDQGFKCLCA